MIYSGRISFESFLLSVQFSKDVINSNLEKLASRGQQESFKIYNDILQGKVCEFFVHERLDHCSHPDIKVYPKSRKSFDADLTCLGYNIHVKSCKKEDKIHSWVFQPEDNNFGDTDTFALCLIDNKLNVDFKIFKYKDLIFKPPLNPNLNKKVVYKDDLKWT